MRRVRANLAGKAVAAVLFVALVFTSSMFGMEVVQTMPFWGTEGYEETEGYYYLLRREAGSVAKAFALHQELQEKDLDYLTRKSKTENLKTLKTDFLPESTNLRGVVRDVAGTVVATNLEEGEALPGTVFYGSFRLGDYSVQFQSADRSYAESPAMSEGEEPAPQYTIECSAPPISELLESGVEDDIYSYALCYQRSMQNLDGWLIAAVSCLAGAALCLLYLLWTAGHRPGETEIALSWQERIWFDVYLCAAVLVGGTVFCIELYLMEALWYSMTEILLAQLDQGLDVLLLASLGFSALNVVLACTVALVLRTLVVRLKARALARSTLLCRVLMWCWRNFLLACAALRTFAWSLPFLWRTVAASLVYFFADVMLFIEAARGNATAGFLWFLLNLCLFAVICWWGIGFQQLRKGSRTIASGNLSHQIDTSRLPRNLKEHGEDLNNISVGLQEAVDQQMKSERFKAELITNVSHDLKTPLTSIINYVELLKTTEQSDPNAVEYIQVLDRKAQRLKKLTEDLVEASKASTGTLSVNREKIGMVQLIGQALGEYEEKLRGRNLTLVTALPEEETFVYADGRHLWRVLDNLLSNCCKYAMEGTRVYLELVRGKGQVVLSVKNISREALNVPAERLMERFVRGEESRSTEGSGLGLSIARSLTELQGGTFDLAVDGDLFKAIVTMPQAG